jgi:hypothetical protein
LERQCWCEPIEGRDQSSLWTKHADCGKEKLAPRNRGKDTVNARQGWVALLVTPSVVATVKMELLELKLLDDATEERHEVPVESHFVFVDNLVGEVEIPT